MKDIVIKLLELAEDNEIDISINTMRGDFVLVTAQKGDFHVAKSFSKTEIEMSLCDVVEIQFENMVEILNKMGDR